MISISFLSLAHFAVQRTPVEDEFLRSKSVPFGLLFGMISSRVELVLDEYSSGKKKQTAGRLFETLLRIFFLLTSVDRHRNEEKHKTQKAKNLEAEEEEGGTSHNSLRRSGAREREI